MVAPRAYYNEIDPVAAEVLRHLAAEGIIMPGEVDTRSIKEVSPDDLEGFTQCHFFAGGGLWSIAARQAGWPDTRPLWTGSCPCQPFSSAGKGLGVDDPRHLWPDFYRLIRARRPAVVVGEQVAGKAGYGWLDRVRADLETEAYASRGVDIPACAVDAPHQRQRLYWIAVAIAECGRREGRDQERAGASSTHPSDFEHGHVGDGNGALREGQSHAERIEGSSEGRADVERTDRRDGGRRLLGDADGLGEYEQEGFVAEGWGRPGDAVARRNGSFWSDAEWIECHDGKARRAEPSVRLLVDGLPGRMDLWRIGGNAISPILAAEVLASILDVEAAGVLA